MSETMKWTITGLACAAAVLAAYLWWQQQETTAVQDVAAMPRASTPATEAAPPATAPAAIQHPVPAAAPAEPLPVLDDSDAALAQALAALIGESDWRAWFLPERFVRRVVATVDNLPRPHAPVKTWPLKPVGSWYLTAKAGDSLVAAPENAKRYAAYAALLERLDMRRLAASYLRFYPLFQLAYADLGYPNGYFNDRLVAAIDDLLAAPTPPTPPALVQTKVLYEFADPALERRSAGQKIMLRIGPAHADLARAKLREFRAAIAAAPRPK